MNNHATGEPIDILLVEDNLGDVRLTQEAFKECRVFNELHVVGDGVDAMAFLRRQKNFHTAVRPDLVLLDLNLPRKDGREVLAEMKADKDLKRIPVVVLTTSNAEKDILKVYDLNANCYINKPVDFEQFINVIISINNFWVSVVKFPPY